MSEEVVDLTENEDNGRSDLSRYKNVLNKDRLGDLVLSSSTLVFNPRNSKDLQIENTLPSIEILWKDVIKHQVSPAKYPKPLLKILLSTASIDNNSPSSITFQMADRDDLEIIRKDVTNRIQGRDQVASSSYSKKRPFAEMKHSSNGLFGSLDPTALAVTRATLLASNAALRQQHNYLVTETSTVSEEDFWETHKHLLEDEYARISGMARPGTSSVLQSHLPSSGRVTLGVEEMRQIFILYPAVHKAYEEKVPLELSDEQFWRKYLESEYFHRDRGRIGTAARNHAPVDNAVRDDKKNEKSSGPSFEQQEARAAAVGSDDLFSRYDQKLREEALQKDNQSNGVTPANGTETSRRMGKNLAVGQFDLASTLETERGRLLEGPKDNHPSNLTDDGKGNRVIQKYNRHWAVVLYPDEAVAGSNLMNVARRSVRDILPDSEDAEALGGIDSEMRRLVDFADAPEEDANHASGQGLHKGDEYEPLVLQNVDAYFAGNRSRSMETSAPDDKEKRSELAKKMCAKTQSLVKKLVTDNSSPRLPETCFPPSSLGRELLSALTKKMAQASETEAHSVKMANQLPKELRNRMQTYFRRSSELLRHFYGLRRINTETANRSDSTMQAKTNQKLARIVGGLDTLYREMDSMRKSLTQSETDEMMRKMFLPIMDQLDWAFKLYREGSGGGSSGGFVTVEEL
jgi:transcription initiation factor TFIIH subunit 1